MIRKISVLFVALAFISVVFAQEVVRQKAPLKADPLLDNTAYNVMLSGDSPVTFANYIAVDTMANSFGPASNTLNPLAFDPYANVLAVVHRGNSNYAVGSGELWWNYSTDFGVSWQRSNTSVQNSTTTQNVARYPSMTIANYTNSTNMADLLGAFSWPELNPSTFGWLGYGVSEGLLESAFAGIISAVPPNDYSSNVPTFSDDQYVYWTSDFFNGGNGGNAALRLFRTADYSTVDIIDPPTWNSARFSDNGNIQCGGVAYNGTVYVGVLGSFSEEYAPNGWNIGYSKSTDNGTTWSDWNIADFTTIPSLGAYQLLWDWKLGDTFVSYSGDIQVDQDGFVHFVTGLLDTNALTPAIFEIYETAANVWDAKMIAQAHDLSDYGYNDNTPGLGQTGPSIMIASNLDRDFFAVQYTIGSPETADTLCDLYYHTRSLTDANWSGATNLTGTDNMNEDGCHIAPYMATTGGSDYIFSLFWYEQGNTTPIINQTNPSVVFVAPVAVRSAGTAVTNTLEFTADITTLLGAGGEPFDPTQDSLLVEGLIWDDLGMNVVGNRRMVSTGTPGIYTTTLTVTSGPNAPNGVGDSTKWKFKAYPDARFVNNGWETTPDRWFVYVADGSTVTLPVIVPNITPILDVTEIGDQIPTVYDLGQNYPNPFNPSTTIRFSLPEAGLVTLKVFNMLGQEIATLVNSEEAAGVYETAFDASLVSNGVYFYTLKTKNFTSTKKMVLLK
jgi:hypothetical protein